jgi:hypothetical protein
MHARLLTMPPMMGVANGFITSAPARLLNKIGRRLATIVATVITIGRNRNRAPSFTACILYVFCVAETLAPGKFQT